MSLKRAVNGKNLGINARVVKLKVCEKGCRNEGVHARAGAGNAVRHRDADVAGAVGDAEIPHGQQLPFLALPLRAPLRQDLLLFPHRHLLPLGRSQQYR